MGCDEKREVVLWLLLLPLAFESTLQTLTGRGFFLAEFSLCLWHSVYKQTQRKEYPSYNLSLSSLGSCNVEKTSLSIVLWKKYKTFIVINFILVAEQLFLFIMLIFRHLTWNQTIPWICEWQEEKHVNRSWSALFIVFDMNSLEMGEI